MPVYVITSINCFKFMNELLSLFSLDLLCRTQNCRQNRTCGIPAYMYNSFMYLDLFYSMKLHGGAL